MRNWDLPFEEPTVLTLSADSRFCRIDLYDDQIWELSLGRHEPPSLMMHTTYGLRAQGMSVFPRFIFNDQMYVDPFGFLKKPVLQHFLSNYISLDLAIAPEIFCTAEYWVPDSHTIAGSYHFTNTGNKVITFRFELCSSLKPLEEGENMGAVVMGDSAVLLGKSYNLVPVCLLAGVSQTNSSPFPALWQDFQIVPGKSRTITWAMASLTDAQGSLDRAREVVNWPWEAKIARVFMVNDSQNLDIFTGDPEWDMAFAASQRAAFSLVMDPQSGTVPFVKNRRPDMGYSFAEEGKGVSPRWLKPSSFDAYFLSGLLLPGGSALVQEILNSFLNKYQPVFTHSLEDTRRSFREVLDQPILCTMAAELYQITQDKEWLQANIEALVTFFKLWFAPDQDKDLDGFPEWQNIEQSGLEDSPIFERWKSGTQGLNIHMVESPALPAFLYRECTHLVSLIQAAGREDLLAEIADQKGRLAEQVQSTWNERAAAFLFRDFETHLPQKGKEVFHTRGNGVFEVKARFSKPVRLLAQISGKDDTRRRFQVTLTGKGAGRASSGETTQETIDFFNVSWLHGRAYYTCSKLFSQLDAVEISGMSLSDEITFLTGHHQMTDISTLIPLWAGCMEVPQITHLIEKNLLKQYWTEYGLTASAGTESGTIAPSDKILIPWNQMIGCGLVSAGWINLAADLFKCLMQTVKAGFTRYHEFSEEYLANTASPSGELGNLRGFTPRRLFLECLGVQYIQSNRLFLNGYNPFSWPVTVKYKGVSLTRHETDTTITFTNGQTVSVTGNEAKEIKLTTDRITEEKEYYG